MPWYGGEEDLLCVQDIKSRASCGENLVPLENPFYSESHCPTFLFFLFLLDMGSESFKDFLRDPLSPSENDKTNFSPFSNLLYNGQR